MKKNMLLLLSSLVMSSLVADNANAFPPIGKKSIAAASSSDSIEKTKNDKTNKNMNSSDVMDQFIFFGDFLYWKADVEGTEFAEVGPTDVNLSTRQATIKNHTAKTEGKWEPGVRIGAGYEFGDFDAWELSLVWTHLNARSKKPSYSASSAVAVDASIPRIYPIGIGLLGPTATEASSRWKLNTNILDLELSREFYPTKKLSLTPHAGLRGAWFDFDQRQKFTGLWLSYDDIDPTLSSRQTFSGPTSAKQSFDYKGIGLLAGLDSGWHFNDMWSLDARFGASILYGQYKVNNDFQGFGPSGINNGSPLFVPQRELSHKGFWRVRANIEAFLGLTWKIRFDDDKRSFALCAGYELSQWFQLNEIPSFVDYLDSHRDFESNGTPRTVVNYGLFESSTHGDVSFQGLVVRGTFEF